MRIWMRTWMIAVLLAAPVVAGCGDSEPQTPAGYWEGSGKSNEIMMDDTFRIVRQDESLLGKQTARSKPVRARELQLRTGCPDAQQSASQALE